MSVDVLDERRGRDAGRTTVSISAHGANSFGAAGPATSVEHDARRRRRLRRAARSRRTTSGIRSRRRRSSRVTVDNTGARRWHRRSRPTAASSRGNVNVSVPFAATDATGITSIALQVRPARRRRQLDDRGLVVRCLRPLAWDTAGAADGTYGLRILATDDAGNTISTDVGTPTDVKVDNTVPTHARLREPRHDARHSSSHELSGSATFNLFAGGTDGGLGHRQRRASRCSAAPARSPSAARSRPRRLTSDRTGRPAPPDDCRPATSASSPPTTSATRARSARGQRRIITIDGFPPARRRVFHDRPRHHERPADPDAGRPRRRGDVRRLPARPRRRREPLPGGSSLIGLTYTDPTCRCDGSQDGVTRVRARTPTTAATTRRPPMHRNVTPPRLRRADARRRRRHAVRRPGSTLVDLTWGGSQDMLVNAAPLDRRLPLHRPPRRRRGADVADDRRVRLRRRLPRHLSCTDTYRGRGQDLLLLRVRGRRRLERLDGRARRLRGDPRPDAARPADRVQGAQEGPRDGLHLEPPDRRPT